jgi:hypothetical protein
MSSLPLKVALGDLTPLEVAHPTATRSGIIRALVVGTVAKGTPLVVPPYTPPSASTWTTISVDSGTELLITKAFQINNVKNLSALVFNAVRDTEVRAWAEDFLNLTPAGKKKRVDEVLLAATGAILATSDSPDDEEETSHRSHLLRFLVDELDAATKALEIANARHTAAKMAFVAFQTLHGTEE